MVCTLPSRLARVRHARVRRVPAARSDGVSVLRRQLASASMRSNGEPPRGGSGLMSAGFWSGSGAGLGWAELKWAGCLGWISGLGLF